METTRFLAEVIPVTDASVVPVVVVGSVVPVVDVVDVVASVVAVVEVVGVAVVAVVEVVVVAVVAVVLVVGAPVVDVVAESVGAKVVIDEPKIETPGISKSIQIGIIGQSASKRVCGVNTQLRPLSSQFISLQLRHLVFFSQYTVLFLSTQSKPSGHLVCTQVTGGGLTQLGTPLAVLWQM